MTGSQPEQVMAYHHVKRGTLKNTSRKWLLVVPLIVFFFLFFVIPVGLMFATSFNPQKVGQIAVIADFTLDNYFRFFQRSNYIMAAGRSVSLAIIVAFITVVVAYPMAFVIAKTRNPRLNTFLIILVLVSMQLDMVIRLYGMMVIFGDNGLINNFLMGLGLIENQSPLPLCTTSWAWF